MGDFSFLECPNCGGGHCVRLWVGPACKRYNLSAAGCARWRLIYWTALRGSKCSPRAALPLP
jgi:hypothetical protein